MSEPLFVTTFRGCVQAMLVAFRLCHPDASIGSV